MLKIEKQKVPGETWALSILC